MSEELKPATRPTIEDLNNDSTLRINLQMAFSRYSHAQRRVQEARQDLREAKKELEALIPIKSEFILKCDYEHYLVTSDYRGGFEAKKLPQFGF